MPQQKPVVIIVGGGFGGLAAAQALKKAPVEVVLIERNNHHTFQPLLYQVATSVLSPGQIASPIRSILKNSTNTTVLLGEVTGVNADAHYIVGNSADRTGVRLPLRLPGFPLPPAWSRIISATRNTKSMLLGSRVLLTRRHSETISCALLRSRRRKKIQLCTKIC